MDISRVELLQNKLVGLSLLLAPLLLAASSAAYWLANNQTAYRVGGTLQVYAFFLFIPALLGLTRLLWQQAPRFALASRLLAIYGCIGGVNYGMDRIYNAVVEQSGAHETTLITFQEVSEFGLPLVLNLPGITFPISMLVLGIALWRTRTTPAWVGLALAGAAVSFPLTRIPDLSALYFIADTLFIVSLGWIGIYYLTATTFQNTPLEQGAA